MVTGKYAGKAMEMGKYAGKAMEMGKYAGKGAGKLKVKARVK